MFKGNSMTKEEVINRYLSLGIGRLVKFPDGTEDLELDSFTWMWCHTVSTHYRYKKLFGKYPPQSYEWDLLEEIRKKEKSNG